MAIEIKEIFATLGLSDEVSRTQFGKFADLNAAVEPLRFFIRIADSSLPVQSEDGPPQQVPEPALEGK